MEYTIGTWLMGFGTATALWAALEVVRYVRYRREMARIEAYFTDYIKEELGR